MQEKQVNQAVQAEEWRDIKGYEGRYQVSNTGKVRSLNYHMGRGKVKELRPQSTRGKKQHKPGSCFVILCNKGAKEYKQVARLVYETFAGEIYDETTIQHKDGDLTNNNINNLYTSVIEVKKDGVKMTFNNQQIAADYFGVHVSVIYHSINGRVKHKRGKLAGYTLSYADKEQASKEAKAQTERSKNVL